MSVKSCVAARGPGLEVELPLGVGVRKIPRELREAEGWRPLSWTRQVSVGVNENRGSTR
jgi:hypothetical protein